MQPTMLSHTRRKVQVHVLSLDPILAADVQARIASDPRMKGCRVIRPPQGDLDSAVAAIEKMAPETVDSRLIVIDVRRQGLPKLQHAYNKVSGYNRRDLGEFCNSILIGDGPQNLFGQGTTLERFAPLLRQLRIDYNPGAFFYDPFLHYTADEQQLPGIDSPALKQLPCHVPARLAEIIREEGMTIEDVRKHFRAAAAPAALREQTKARRQEKLVQLFTARMSKAFDGHDDQLQDWLSARGASISGEALRLHLYPLYFEDWAYKLLVAAKLAGKKHRDKQKNKKKR